MNSVYALKTMSQLRPFLAGFRKVNGLTQKDIAERLGITQQSYARLEANPGSASIERLFRVLNMLGVEMLFTYGSASKATELMEVSVSQRSLPARREKW